MTQMRRLVESYPRCGSERVHQLLLQSRSFTARDVILTLQYLFAVRGAPEHIRSDNGPEFVAHAIQPG